MAIGLFFEEQEHRKRKFSEREIHEFSSLIDIILTGKEAAIQLTGEQLIYPLNLITAYAARTRELDKTLKELTRSYCAAECGPSIGCCSDSQHYSYGVPEEMLQLQEIEALDNGWAGNDDGCKYHTQTGCSLTLFKSPCCIGYLCNPLIGKIRYEYSCSEADTFLNEMEKVHYGTLKFSTQWQRELLENMDKAVEAGRRLVDMK